MKNLYLVIVTIFLWTFSNAFAAETTANTTTQDVTPQQVLQRLKDGNNRFINNQMEHHDLLSQAHATASGQTPSAVILNCMDSRVAPEVYFDQGIGDIFVNRVAGNVLNSDIVGGMEYATKVMGSKLIVVMGHTSCGAVKGACDQVKLGNLTQLVQKIMPAVKLASKELKTTNCSDDKFVDQIAKDNVLMIMKQIPVQSPTIKQLLKEGKIGIVGAMQDIATGKVIFIDETSETKK